MGMFSWIAASSIEGSVIDQNSWMIEWMRGQNLVRDAMFMIDFLTHSRFDCAHRRSLVAPLSAV
jgi:hypothetical protein